MVFTIRSFFEELHRTCKTNRMPANTLLLRISVSTILLMHSVPAIFNNSIPGFGVYLDQSGMAPVGIVLAWAIKLSHIAAGICFLLNRWIKPACIVTILVLMAGIFIVHLPQGWFVVGGGTNGIEFNFLLIFALLTILFPYGHR